VTYTVIVRDVNGNTLGRVEFEWGMTIALPPEAHVNDYGDVVIVTLVGDDPIDEDQDAAEGKADRAIDRERDDR
jgi:hypothetical protein